LAAAAFISLGSLVAGSPKLELSWRNPAATGGPFKNIMVLALNGKAENRAEFEDELVAAIAGPGQTAVQSYEFVPRPDGVPLDVKELKEQIRDNKFDAVVAARLVKRVEKQNYVPGEVYSPFPYYATFYGYYAVVAPVVYTPGYMETEKEAQVEVNFYSTAKPDGELVWTGTTNTFDAKSPIKVIHDLVKIVSKELEDQKIILPKPE
jgi:hypothetical protein